METSSRDPYPPLKFENDFTLSGHKSTQRKTFERPTHLAQIEEPWSRLYDCATWSSFTRSAMYYDHQAPRDSLDFKLKTVYDHHKDVFCSKNQIFFQKDTVCEKQRHTEKQDDKEAGQDQEITRWVDPKRCSIHSIK